MPMTRSAINVVEKVTMGSFLNKNLGSLVHPVGAGHSVSIGPITEDAEVVTNAKNPSPDQVQDPELPFHPEITTQTTYSNAEEGGPGHRMSGPI